MQLEQPWECSRLQRIGDRFGQSLLVNIEWGHCGKGIHIHIFVLSSCVKSVDKFCSNPEVVKVCIRRAERKVCEKPNYM